MGCCSSAELEPHSFDNLVVKETIQAVNLSDRKAIVIVNPYSGQMRGVLAFELITPIFEAGGISIIKHETKYSGHAQEIANTVDLNGIDLIVSIGGDGTCHEVTNGFMSRSDYDTHKDRVSICIIPAGTGNGLAYDLKLVSQKDAAEKAVRGQSRFIDIVECTTPSTTDGDNTDDKALLTDKDWKKYSMNIVGCGLSPAVLDRANSLRCCAGGAKYEFAAYCEVINNIVYECTITFPESDDIDPEIRKFCAAKQKYHMMQSQTTVHMGDKIPFAPRAKLDDGLLDLVLVKHGTRCGFVSSIEAAKVNQHLEQDNFIYIQASEYTLTPSSADQQGEKTLNIDGELAGMTPVNVKVKKQAMQVIC
jgi:diacylglycerol kinase family enzyme